MTTGRSIDVAFTQETNVESSDFRAAMEIYVTAFPANEQQPLAILKESVQKGLNKLFVGRMGNEVVFMALLWPLKQTDFILLDYMATSPLHRGKHIASLFLQSRRPLLEKNKQQFVIEVEDPDYGNNKEERQKRINFYKKNDAKELKGVRYMLPPLQGADATDMRLLIFPGVTNGSIPAVYVKQLITQVYKELYHRNANDSLLTQWPYDSDTQIELV